MSRKQTPLCTSLNKYCQPCGLRTRKGYLCWHHQRIDLGFRVKKINKLKGFGLVAEKDFKKDEFITTYDGKLLKPTPNDKFLEYGLGFELTKRPSAYFNNCFTRFGNTNPSEIKKLDKYFDEERKKNPGEPVPFDLNSTRTNMGYGRYLNACDYKHKRIKKTCNVYIEDNIEEAYFNKCSKNIDLGCGPRIRAAKDIKKGEELLFPYGSDYVWS